MIYNHMEDPEEDKKIVRAQLVIAAVVVMVLIYLGYK